MHVVVDPEPCWQGDGQGCEANAAGEREQVVEDWYCFGEHEGNCGKTERAGEPCAPVDHGVGLEMG